MTLTATCDQTRNTNNAETVITDTAVEIAITALLRVTKVWYCCARTNTGTPLGNAAWITATVA